MDMDMDEIEGIDPCTITLYEFFQALYAYPF